MVDTSALMAHIVSQTRQNIDFLISQRQIPEADGREILAKLPQASDPSILALSGRTQRIMLGNESVSPTGAPEPRQPVGVSRRPPPPPAGRRVSQARALWGYNEDGSDPNDLSFRSGDVIEIVAETNEDWWTGRNNGRQGLFPSNYVEKINGPSVSPAPPSYPPPNKAGYGASSPMPVYSPPPASPYPGPPMGYQVPSGPPPNAYNPYMNPPVMAPAPVAAPPAPEQPKKSRFGGGGLGQTMMTAAAGGVGFGAGSALAGDLVNSIF